MMCKIIESPLSKNIEDKPILKSLIEKYFLGKGEEIKDYWLVSIGYSMLNEHVKSANCLGLLSG